MEVRMVCLSRPLISSATKFTGDARKLPHFLNKTVSRCNLQMSIPASGQ